MGASREAGARILGTGAYLPRKVVTNSELAGNLGIDEEWIRRRTGIRERRVCSPGGGESPSGMAEAAARAALESAGLRASDVGMILFATMTPDQPLPSSASLLQERLGSPGGCASVDLSAACSGFVYGVGMADSFIGSGMADNVLVVASETVCREIDWSDRDTCILFGDGCGAAVLGRGGEGGVLATRLGCDSSGRGLLEVPQGGGLRMRGGEMFKTATRALVGVAREVLDQAGMGMGEVDWFVPHQGNIRVVEAVAKRLEFPMDKVVSNIEYCGNTSAASIPIALHEGISDGRIRRGDVVLLGAVGAGVTYGATLLRY